MLANGEKLHLKIDFEKRCNLRRLESNIFKSPCNRNLMTYGQSITFITKLL